MGKSGSVSGKAADGAGHPVIRIGETYAGNGEIKPRYLRGEKLVAEKATPGGNVIVASPGFGWDRFSVEPRMLDQPADAAQGAHQDGGEK